MERASMRATADICPCPGFEPSLLGKFLVVWRMEKPLWLGVSPAPKQGPQKAVFMTAPASARSAKMPFLMESMYTGIEEGYTLRENSPDPVDLPLRALAASARLVKLPPAQPPMTPCCTWSLPFLTLSSRVYGALPFETSAAFFSVSARMSVRSLFSSSMVKALEGWKGMAIIGFIFERSMYTQPS